MVKPITLREVVARLNEAQAGVVIHTVRGLGYRLDAASDLPPQAEPD